MDSKINWEEFYRPYLQNMKRVGTDKIQGLCPFHDDTRPSFWFNINNGCFKCEACAETGNGITFLEKKEGIDRKEANNRLKKLAGEGKYTLEEYSEQKHLPLDYLKSLGLKNFREVLLFPTMMKVDK